MLCDFGFRYASGVGVCQACSQIRSPCLAVQGNMLRSRGFAAYVRDGYGAFRHSKFDRGTFKLLVFKVWGIIQNLYAICLYRNTDLDDWIFV